MNDLAAVVAAANSAPMEDGGLVHENEGKIGNKGEAEGSRRVATKGIHRDRLGSSRSLDNDRGKDVVVILQDIFGDSYNETNKKLISPKCSGVCAEGFHAENVEPETEVGLFDVFGIPLRHPPAAPEQMATMRLSNLIGVDPKPFDPRTYVDEDISVTDESGSKRCIPHTNIIRWRKVNNPDGTTSIESNSRFITWPDGSVQLFIGDEAFEISEQSANFLQSHLFLSHGKGIYQSQGKIHRKMKFMPSSISSKSHHALTTLVQSRNKKVNNVRHHTTEIDPERMVEQIEKAEKKTRRASKKLEKEKKKVADKYKHMGCMERGLTPGFLEDNEELNELPATVYQHDLDQEKEAKAEKRIMKAKKGEKGITHSGKESEHYEDSDVDAEQPRENRKQYIESDEDTPSRKPGTRRRQFTISYDGKD